MSYLFPRNTIWVSFNFLQHFCTHTERTKRFCLLCVPFAGQSSLKNLKIFLSSLYAILFIFETACVLKIFASRALHADKWQMWVLCAPPLWQRCQERRVQRSPHLDSEVAPPLERPPPSGASVSRIFTSRPVGVPLLCPSPSAGQNCTTGPKRTRFQFC